MYTELVNLIKYAYDLGKFDFILFHLNFFLLEFKNWFLFFYDYYKSI